jgi:hypothetical protein
MALYTRRKLLVATLGLGTISYVLACDPPTSGNLPAPPETDDKNPPPTSGNLPSPPPRDAAPDADAEVDAGADADASTDAPADG